MAIGDIGINRTLKYCKANNIPIISQISLDSPDYIPDINPISACHYIYRTIIPTANNFYTATAKKLAAVKIIVFENYINK